MAQAVEDRHLVQSVERAARLLLTLGEADHGASLADLSAAAGLNKSTARRLLVTLMDTGLVRQPLPTDDYSLGPGLLGLSGSARRHLFSGRLTYSVLVDLRNALNETVHLAIPDEFDMIYLEKVESNQNLQIASRVGARVSLYCTGLGRAYLAHLPEDRVRDYLRVTPLEKRTPRTLTSQRQLLAELRTTRERGYSLDDVENEDGLRCIGAAVLDPTGRPVAAISVTAPDTRLTTELVPAFGARVADAARRIGDTLR